jgi:hypothetical protein
MLYALFVSCVSLPMRNSIQEFSAEGDGAIGVDDTSPPVFNVAFVVTLITDLALEMKDSVALLLPFLEVALVFAKGVLKLACVHQRVPLPLNLPC